MSDKMKISDKVFFRLVVILSVVVFLAVIILNRKVLPRPEVLPEFAKSLPLLNAIINATCTVLLIASYLFIRRKRVAQHRILNISTFFLSCLFLVSYITYHYLADETHFPADNPIRPIYLAILFSHIICAAGVLPLILVTFYRGLKGEVEKHRKLARITFPIWLYVTLTGVIVYLMISPYYPF